MQGSAPGPGGGLHSRPALQGRKRDGKVKRDAHLVSGHMRDGGEAISDKHYLAYDVPVAANDSTTLTLGVAMQATDVLSIAAGGTASLLSFNAFGAEVTV